MNGNRRLMLQRRREAASESAEGLARQIEGPISAYRRASYAIFCECFEHPLELETCGGHFEICRAVRRSYRSCRGHELQGIV